MSATRQFGGASWNRTSDLSIIREVSGIPLVPGVSQPVPFSLLTGAPQF